MSTAHSNDRTTRRWPLLLLSVPASLSIAVVAVACASEGEVAPEQPQEPQVIQPPDGGTANAAATDGDSAAPVDGGIVPGGSCSDSDICSVDLPLEAPVSLTSVWGSGPSDVWSVGTAGTILHYDGTKWERADLEAQDAGTAFTLRAVWLDGPNDVWIADGARIRHSNGWNGPTGTEWQIYSYAATAPPISGIRGKDGMIWMSRRRATGATKLTDRCTRIPYGRNIPAIQATSSSRSVSRCVSVARTLTLFTVTALTPVAAISLAYARTRESSRSATPSRQKIEPPE